MRRLLMLIAALSALLPCVAAAKDQPPRRRAGANLVTLRLSDENAAVAPDENAVIPQEIQSEDIKGFDEDLGIPPKPDDPKGEPVKEEDTPPILAPEEIPSEKPAYSADEESDAVSADDEFYPIAGIHGPPPKPAQVCSSGDWVNSGGRYFQIDFSYLVRIGPEDFVVAEALPLAELASEETLGFSPGVRFTAGRFLCRDGKNRDHNLEATFFGGHEWFDSKGIEAALRGVEPVILINTNFSAFAPGFQNSASQRYEYGSDFDSFEVNWRGSKRLGRDRMELRRNGCWVRKCAPGPVTSFIAGIRAVGIDEEYNYFAQGEDPATRFGEYRIQTKNEMLGLQLGTECFFQNCRWRAGVRAKGGPYIDWSRQRSQVRALDFVDQNNDGDTNDQFDVPPFSVSRDEEADSDHLAFLGEVNLIGAYSLRPNVAVKVQYDLMWVNQIATGPEQINFAVRNPPDVVTGGSLFYQGGSLGIELIW